MFEFIIIGAVGILFSIFGYLIMVKKKTSLIHDYHLRGVKDIKNYCSFMGGCLFLLGVVFIVFSILGFTEILTFAQMQLSIFIVCIADVVALFCYTRKICRAYTLGSIKLLSLKLLKFSHCYMR